MEIIKADICRLPEVARIERESFGDPWSQSSFLRILNDGVFCFLVCVEEGAVIGYVIGMIVSPEAEIINLAVDAPHRRKGVGSLLLDALIANAKSKGCGAFYLEVRRSNTGARQLYESFGFTCVGVRKRYYAKPVEDALLMLKTENSL